MARCLIESIRKLSLLIVTSLMSANLLQAQTLSISSIGEHRAERLRNLDAAAATKVPYEFEWYYLITEFLRQKQDPEIDERVTYAVLLSALVNLEENREKVISGDQRLRLIQAASTWYFWDRVFPEAVSDIPTAASEKLLSISLSLSATSIGIDNIFELDCLVFFDDPRVDLREIFLTDEFSDCVEERTGGN